MTRRSSQQGHANAKAARRRMQRPRSTFESLEGRDLMAVCDILPMITSAINGVSSSLQSVETSIDNVSSGLGDLPLVGDYVVNNGAKIKQPVTDLRLALSQFSTDVASLPDQGQAALRGLLFDAIGPNSTLNILGDTNGDGSITVDDAAITIDTDNCGVDVQLKLGRELSESVGDSTDFDVGVGSIPITVTATGGVEARVGFEIPQLHFGYTQADGFYFDDSAPTDVQIYAAANFVPNTSLTVDVGFLSGSLADGDLDSSAMSQLQFSLPLDIANGGVTTTGPQVQADLYLQLSLGGNAYFPSLSTEFELHRTFGGGDSASLVSGDDGSQNLIGSNSDDGFVGVEILTAAFHHVQVELGEYLSGILSPVVDFVKDVTSPIQPIVDVLTTPIPVLSDIPVLNDLLNYDDDPNDEVTLVDIAQLAYGAGAIPPGYAELVNLAVFVVDIMEVVNDLKIDPAGNVAIDFGSFDVVHSQGGSLLDLADVSAVTKNGTTIVDADLGIAGLGGNFNLDSLKQQYQGQLPAALEASLDGILDKLTSGLNNGINYAFPLIDNPAASVFQLLIGRDAELFTLGIDYDVDSSVAPTCADMPGLGIAGCFEGAIHADTKIEIGYDTFGLRKMIVDTQHSVGNLLDGIYITQDSHLILDGEIGASLGADYLLFHADVEGGVEANISIDVATPAQDFDGDPNKVRLFEELDECLFVTSGSLRAYLSASASIGVETFLGDIEVAEVHFDLANQELLSFNAGCIGNPRHVDDPNLATRQADGTLDLHVGAMGMQRGIKAAEVTEVFDASQVVGPGGRIDIVVSAFGFSETYEDISSVRAFAGDGDDSITIHASVTIPVELHGEGGQDLLTSHGIGNASLFGDAGNDQLQGGDGPLNVLIGGADDDTLLGGGIDDTTFNILGELNGEFGDDVLVGGAGLNTMYGGWGDDLLKPGPLADYVDGGAGDDLIEVGTGDATLLGDRGDDQFIWMPGDGQPSIDGQGDDDVLVVLGTSSKDTFVLSAAGAAGRVQTPTNKLLDAFNVEGLQVEGLGDEDTITVHSLVGTTVANVGVNLADALAFDYAKDQVFVRGTEQADVLNVSQEAVIISPEGADHGTIGGVTRIEGLPNYVVRVVNTEDELRVQPLAHDDTINVLGVTGPTWIEGNEGFETFNVTTASPSDYLGPLTLDTGVGASTVNFATKPSPFPDLLTPTVKVTQDQLSARWVDSAKNIDVEQLVNLVAPFGGSFVGGVNVTTTTLADTVLVVSTRAGVTTSVTTGDSDDTVQVGSGAGQTPGTLNAILGTLVINTGKGAANVIRLDDSAAVAGNANVLVNAASVQNFAGPNDATSVQFASTGGEATLVLEGANSSLSQERFTLNGPAVKAQVNGNAGRDMIDVLQLIKPATINGGAGDDVIRVTPGGNLGLLLADVHVIGASGTDSVTIADHAAQVAGTYQVAGNNISRNGTGVVAFDTDVEGVQLSTSQIGSNIIVSANPIVTLVSIQGGAGLDTLRGSNFGANQWVVRAANDVALNSNVVARSVESLVGGLGNDRFEFRVGGSLSGSIDGQGGTANVLDYSTRTDGVTVDLAAGTATGVGGNVTNVRNVLGGAGNDRLFAAVGGSQLAGNDGHDILVGRDASDQLSGGRGFDLVIGGEGSDFVDGGDDDDIVIGNRTAHDANVAALDAILAEWAQPAKPFAARCQALYNGGGLNGNVKLNPATILEDFDGDSLTGGTGRDWFWVGVGNSDAMTDFLSTLDRKN